MQCGDVQFLTTQKHRQITTNWRCARIEQALSSGLFFINSPMISICYAINENGTYIDMVGDCPLTAGFSNASFESLVLRKAHGRFRTSVSAAKNPVPGAEKVWWRELRPGAVAAECALRLKSVNVKKWNQGRARPSRSNCSDHSAGASRKVAMPMPRGSRPSTAALTRAGAMNAIDIVMLT